VTTYLAAGFADLLAELDFMHPANGDAPPRFITVRVRFL
jgi:hypothetical protein